MSSPLIRRGGWRKGIYPGYQGRQEFLFHENCQRRKRWEISSMHAYEMYSVSVEKESEKRQPQQGGSGWRRLSSPQRWPEEGVDLSFYSRCTWIPGWQRRDLKKKKKEERKKEKKKKWENRSVWVLPPDARGCFCLGWLPLREHWHFSAGLMPASTGCAQMMSSTVSSLLDAQSVLFEGHNSCEATFFLLLLDAASFSDCAVLEPPRPRVDASRRLGFGYEEGLGVGVPCQSYHWYLQ